MASSPAKMQCKLPRAASAAGASSSFADSSGGTAASAQVFQRVLADVEGPRAGSGGLFAEVVAQHEPLLPALSGEDAEAVCRAGGVPELAELCLHLGTVWRWNRPVYDASGAGRLRIELRALPAGPTATDMVANLAFLVGLILGLAPHMNEHTARITFGQTRRSFYEAARLGLAAELLWPAERAPSQRLLTVQQALPELLRLAREGLVNEGGVEPAEADAWLGRPIRRSSVRNQHVCNGEAHG